MAALEHADAARRRALPATGMAATVARLSTDDELQRHLRDMRTALDKAQKRVRRKKQSHRLRNTLIVVGGTGAAIAAVPVLRHRFSSNGTGVSTDLVDDRGGDRGRRAGLDGVQPVDAVRGLPALHGGRRPRRAARRHPPALGRPRSAAAAPSGRRRSSSRCPTRGSRGRASTAARPAAPSGSTRPASERTQIRLVLTYRPEGPLEKVGSAAGLDRRRIRGDLERFKELLEMRGVEDGAWRGEVESGATTATACKHSGGAAASAAAPPDFLTTSGYRKVEPLEEVPTWLRVRRTAQAS